MMRDQDAPNQSGSRLSGEQANDRWANAPGAGGQNVQTPGNMGTMSGLAEGETSAADQQRPDTRIQSEVAWLLQSMELVDADTLQVDVQDGTVTLHGTVSHPQAVQQVEEHVRLIADVTDVQNQLQVRKPSANS